MDSTVLLMLIALNELDALIPIERGYSLLPFKNFDNIGLVLWNSDKNSDVFSGLGGVLLENDERSGLLASGISFIDGEHLCGVGYLSVV